MNQLILNLASSVRNRHVSIPIILALGCQIGKIWKPAYYHQLDSTQKILMAYGTIAAANTGPVSPSSEQLKSPKDSGQ